MKWVKIYPKTDKLEQNSNHDYVKFMIITPNIIDRIQNCKNNENTEKLKIDDFDNDAKAHKNRSSNSFWIKRKSLPPIHKNIDVMEVPKGNILKSEEDVKTVNLKTENLFENIKF